ncbi:DNA mismatch repair protein MutS [Natrialba asiatica]|uniref:DNA mismatch repair protein MutS n=1 Tax=Natrialba asiatica (strain ATCC 700177 / DSM 12278 / JCM 9576 / FERM P-10747 / NBRC 102637 / 172P1) TaxID=29540 RepID=M0AZF4_NATA1|nr:DNA mismatch repair protein MutS [Natrialba asiatica]ELZ03910.1 DNA mismatch repair protein MutS [Natrialba asiatica DSM 12278]
MTEATGIVGEFFSLKEGTDAELLAMQCGDFYEFFGEDAETVSDELDLKVSQKSSHGSSYPMAGVPLDDLTPYLKALVERGYRVAVADQYETESGHAREIQRVVTPGTLLETSDADAQYLAAVVDGGSGSDPRYGLAFADVTTGRFLVAEAADTDAALTELYRFDPVEVLPGPDSRTDDDLLGTVRERIDAALTLHETEAFAPKRAAHAVREQFGRETVERLSVGPEATAAAGAILAYVEETGAGVLASMTRIQAHHGDDHVTLDATTQRNLELTETMQGEREGSLFATIDHTETSAGGRLLKEWLQRPRRALETLEQRQESVAALSSAALERDEIQDTLDEAYDLARLASKATHGSADARDLLAVRETLAVLPALAETIDSTPNLADSPLAGIIDRPDRAAAADLREALEDAIADDPPSTVTQGELLQYGYDDDLDEVIDRHEEVKQWLDTLDEREKRQHGLSHVTVDRNKTDGYYIQVGKSAADGVPDHYEQVKTLKNSKRFTTDDLEEKEREILRLEEQRGELEYDLFEALRDDVAERAELLQDVGRALAAVDALASLATHAAENRWVKPGLHRGDALDIDQGRHPVVEQTTEFVPNDVRLDGEDRGFLVVTGPNMSGKSTYMRQVACIVLLAQIGSFVPAKEAEIGLVDGIFTRVGALDELAQGRSTFMVEMSELSNILHTATEESLVVLDEVGRGTATYDGISIAWAATEYLHNEVAAKTLFATHYHELTGLAENLPRVANVHVAADERDGDVTFLRAVRDGPTDRSYGIHVADLAGVPGPVVDRARDVLTRLREEKAIEAKGGDAGEPVQTVFDVGSGQFRGPANADGGETSTTGQTAEDHRSSGSERAGGSRSSSEASDGAPTDTAESDDIDPETEAVLDDLEELDVNATPPVELITKVQEWQEKLSE